MKIKNILVEEFLRALAIGWGALLVLGLVYQDLGLTSEGVLIFSISLGLVSLVFFTILRKRTNKSYKVTTRRGWVVLGVIVGIVVLLITIVNIVLQGYDANKLIGLLAAIALIIITVYWGRRPE
jgi:phosphatidylserine synthase